MAQLGGGEPRDEATPYSDGPTCISISFSMEASMWRRLTRPTSARPNRFPLSLKSRLKKRRKRRYSHDSSDKGVGYGAWDELNVPRPVSRALLENGITVPTEIQQRAITAALGEQCDLIGAAETVGGCVQVWVCGCVSCLLILAGFWKDTSICHSNPPSYSELSSNVFTS